MSQYLTTFLATVVLSSASTLAHSADLSLTSHTGASVYGNTSVGTLTAGGGFTIPSSGSVEFRANTLVRLTPGFTATSGSTFTAKIVFPTLVSLAITRNKTPPFLTGQAIDFNAQGYDQTGQAMSVPVAWSLVSGSGTINSSTGLYTPVGVGSATVKATSGSINTTDTVYIQSATAPTARFTFSLTNVDNPLGYSFNGSTSTAVSGRSITQYQWNFDGVSANTSGSTTTYEFPGGYGHPVTLQVVDNAGEISAPVTQTVSIPASQLIYLSAYSATQTSTPPYNASISNWSLGYSLSAEPHSHPGYFPAVTSRSIEMGYGWRTRLNQTNGKYEGFKADLTRQSLNYYVAVKLLVASSNPNSHLFLSGYGLDHTLSSMKPVGRGWVEDMGSTNFRPRFIPDKSQPAQTICLGTHVFEYTATGGQNPGLTASSYYLGQPISNGACLGLGWIEGVWRNSSPFIATLTYGTDTAQETEAWLGTSRYSIWSSSHFSLRPGYLYTGYSTVEPTSYDPNYGMFPVRQRIGYGYLEGSGMVITFIPSGAQ